MKLLIIAVMFFFATASYAQKKLPHGMVFGQKPDTIAMMPASKVEAFMGKKIRISTTIEGRVIRVTKQKGGWFDVDAGGGKIIAAHFKDYNINLPVALAGRTVIIEGVAAKQIIADDMQHFAGDTVTGQKQHNSKSNPLKRLTFEVKGLFIDK